MFFTIVQPIRTAQKMKKTLKSCGRLVKENTFKTNPLLKGFENEMTGNLFNNHGWNRDYIKVINITTALDRAPKLPPPPKVDYHTLKNHVWKNQYHRGEVVYHAFKLLDLKNDLFKNEALSSQHEVSKNFKENLGINLKVSYGPDYYDNALLGNYLEGRHTVNAPIVTFPTDGIHENDKYTLVMFTPDYPFRLNPDSGVFVNWMVSNIKGSDISKGNVSAEYLQPLPTEYAGTFRFVFYLLKQKRDCEIKMNSFEERKNFDLRKFTRENCVSMYPQGFSCFRTEYELEVSLKYKELGIEEPEYIPLDIQKRQEHKRSKQVKLHSDRW
jgi:hypothetical protein